MHVSIRYSLKIYVGGFFGEEKFGAQIFLAGFGFGDGFAFDGRHTH